MIENAASSWYGQLLVFMRYGVVLAKEFCEEITAYLPLLPIISAANLQA